MTEEVAVLVPIYRDALGEYEEVSFRNIVTVLKDYPIYFVKPASLELAEVERSFRR